MGPRRDAVECHQVAVLHHKDEVTLATVSVAALAGLATLPVVLALWVGFAIFRTCTDHVDAHIPHHTDLDPSHTTSAFPHTAYDESAAVVFARPDDIVGSHRRLDDWISCRQYAWATVIDGCERDALNGRQYHALLTSCLVHDMFLRGAPCFVI